MTELEELPRSGGSAGWQARPSGRTGGDMDRVLLDGTMLISVARLLNGEDRPSALNVFALLLMVESLILHDRIIVIDTLENDDRLSNAARSLRGYCKCG